jgi:hypothetical protein
MADLIASVEGMEIAEAARSLTDGNSSRRSRACETAVGPGRRTAAEAQSFSGDISVRTRIGRDRLGIPLYQLTRLSCAVPRGETRTRRRAEAHRADPQATTAGDRGHPAGRRRGRYRGACRSRSGSTGRPPYGHHGRCPGMSSYAVRWPGRGGLTIHVMDRSQRASVWSTDATSSRGDPGLPSPVRWATPRGLGVLVAEGAKTTRQAVTTRRLSPARLWVAWDGSPTDAGPFQGPGVVRNNRGRLIRRFREMSAATGL